MNGIGKSTFREIKSSFGRFMAIFAIIALGVGFFAGLKVTKEGMVATVRKYLDDHAFFDYRLLSTMGFEQEDVERLALEPDVEAAEGALSFDILYRLENGSQGVAKTHSVTQRLNTLKLVSGRMPEKGNECVADSNLFREEDIGTVIYLSGDNEEEDLEHFAYREYQIVGIARSPLYIQYERGNTSLGTGKVDGYLYLAPEGFEADYFTEIYVRFSQEHDLYSEGYTSFMDGKEPVWEDVTASAAQRRYKEILEEAEAELADAQAEFDEKKAEGEEELAEAAAELADAEKEIRDGEQALTDAKEEIEDGERRIRENERELQVALNTIAESEKELEEGQRTLDEKEEELRNGERKLEDGKSQWRDNSRIIEESKKELALQKGQLESQAEQLAAGKEALGAAAEESAGQILAMLPPGLPEEQNALLRSLVLGLIGVAKGEQSVSSYLEQLDALPGGENSPFEELKNTLASAAEELGGKRAEIQAGEQTIAAYLAQVEEGQRQLLQGEQELEKAGQQIRESERQLDEGKKAIADARQSLADGRRELEDAKKEVEEGRAAIADGKKELAEARETLADKEKELEDGKREYEDGLREYEDARREFEEKIAEGEQELADARQEIADIQEPDTYVLGRDTNVGYVCFENDSNIVEGIANLFPVFFFLVAALVCITTMNRMVEEQRTQIGVLKALGYGNVAIMFKYMAYSGLAALAGCVFGFFAGTWGFPKVIWFCYGIMYNADPIFYVFSWKLAVISLIVSLLCSIGTTWLSCRVELSQVAAALMRPKAPRAGKRVFLERVPFVWKRLKFLQKVTVRNLFRYKKRLFMMVLGISGCTALLVTGFGIKDSIADIASKQFQEIQVYDISVSLKENADDALEEKLNGLENSGLGEYLCVMEKNMDLVTEGAVKSVWLVAGTSQEMPRFVNFHTSGGEAIAYPGPGEAVISNKLAEDYHVKIGDMITLRDENMHSFTVSVSAIYENYIYNYVHISEETWESMMHAEPERKTVYANLAENIGQDQENAAHALAAELMKLDQVSNVTVNADTMERIGSMMASLDIIVVVVILCAAGLAFIVLYNLTNINITERVREIATIKVLGFYKKETSAYVFRENILLTLFGMGFGLVLGHFLHRLVMNEIRVDLIAFDIWVKPVSFLYSGILTLAFAWLVNRTMGGKLEGISMTESLKSVD